MSERHERLDRLDRVEALLERDYLPIGWGLDGPNVHYKENFIHFEDTSALAVSASDISAGTIDPIEVREAFLRNPSEVNPKKPSYLSMDDKERITIVEKNEVQDPYGKPVQALTMNFVKYDDDAGFKVDLESRRTLAEPITFSEAENEIYRKKMDWATKDEKLQEDMQSLLKFLESLRWFKFHAVHEGERIDIDISETIEYITQGRLRDSLKEKGMRPHENDFTHHNAAMMVLANALQAKVMEIKGIPGVSRAVKSDGGVNGYVRIGSDEAAEAASLVGGFTAQTRSPLHTINAMNTAAYLKNPDNPDYPFSEGDIDSMIKHQRRRREVLEEIWANYDLLSDEEDDSIQFDATIRMVGGYTLDDADFSRPQIKN